MNIPFHKPYMTEDEVNSAADSIRNGWLTMGKKTIDFEESFGKRLGAKNSVSVSSCTAALHLSLHVAGIKSTDEVIVPTTTFATTAEVVCYFGAMPVLADINRETHLMDVSDFEKKITPRTKAVIPVHYGGQPCDMDQIHEIARRHNLTVIEDAAHALPATYKGRTVGTISDLTCFSFYATKTLAAGEGGMITTANDEWADKMKMLRIHGITRDAWKRYSREGTWEYDVYDAGFKYNFNDIAASIAIEQLKKLDWMNEKRAAIAAKYTKAFSGRDDIITYRVLDDRTTAWHVYPIKLGLEALKIDRNQFVNILKERGVLTSVHFIPIYRFTYYGPICGSASLYPESEWVFNREISLPIYPSMTDAEIEYVISTVDDICRENRR